MPYKIVPTKTCSECGQVLDSKREDYCDGCNIQISEKDYDKHLRLNFQMKDLDTRKQDLVFHSLECFQQNHAKVDLTGVSCVSIEYIRPSMFKKIVTLLSK